MDVPLEWCGGLSHGMEETLLKERAQREAVWKRRPKDETKEGDSCICSRPRGGFCCLFLFLLLSLCFLSIPLVREPDEQIMDLNRGRNKYKAMRRGQGEGSEDKATTEAAKKSSRQERAECMRREAGEVW